MCIYFGLSKSVKRLRNAPMYHPLQELPHLRVLDLSHNKITCLTDLHTKLGNITKLGLASNSIVRLNGESIPGLLSMVCVSGDPLPTISVGIQKMFSIQYLDLANNQISDVSILNRSIGYVYSC